MGEQGFVLDGDAAAALTSLTACCGRCLRETEELAMVVVALRATLYMLDPTVDTPDITEAAGRISHETSRYATWQPQLL